MLRILDANLNRAREALRVVEDYARFVCDDHAASAGAKRLRHAVRGIADTLGASELLIDRDILADAGRETKTPEELRRDAPESVVRAAFARAQEALRSVGEFAKLVSPPAAEAAERLRYECYALEQTVVLRGSLRRAFAACRVYVIITASLCRGDWLATAAAALRGGATCLQLREKYLPDAELLRRAAALRELTAGHNALLLLNDRADIARLSGADGVHVGQDDLTVRQARSIGGARLLVGKSTHSVAQVEAALSEEPDYIAVGPMFASPTKPGSAVAGPDLLREAIIRQSPATVAIGGIDARRAGELAALGANCACVCSAVLSADDPEAAVRELVEAMHRGRGAPARATQ